ncbi:MAG: hypothetical protein GX349_04925 [Firmicutes bacterium]|nr:hypothetical protein [Bacillota bacterium]
MFRVGFAGTAKNTGKTTALMYFLRRASIRGEQVGLTGIGYDGEEIDHLTGLVKPRLKCPAGTLIVTAKGCLDRMTATYRIIGKLPLSNALGQLLLLKTISPGTVVVAGPNSGKDLRLTMDFFQRAGCELVLVDGAFGRLGPFVEVDGLILATGAARSANIINLVEDTRAFSRVFALPALRGREEIQVGSSISLHLRDGRVKRLQPASLVSESLVAAIAPMVPYASVISLPGVVPGDLLWQLCQKVEGGFSGKTMVFSDPTKLLLAGNYERAAAALAMIVASGGRPVVKRRIPLLALTVNPFYPLQTKNTFRRAFINDDQLKEALRGVSQVPVLNVKEREPNYYLDIANGKVRSELNSQKVPGT